MGFTEEFGVVCGSVSDVMLDTAKSLWYNVAWDGVDAKKGDDLKVRYYGQLSCFLETEMSFLLTIHFQYYNYTRIALPPTEDISIPQTKYPSLTPSFYATLSKAVPGEVVVTNSGEWVIVELANTGQKQIVGFSLRTMKPLVVQFWDIKWHRGCFRGNENA